MKGNVKDSFVETLDEYVKGYHDNEEFIRLFYVMDSTMKYIHGRGYYVINFNPKNIIVGKVAENDYINFKSIDIMDDDVTNKINNNIYNLAFLEIGLLSNTLEHLRPDFLKQNYSQFKLFIPENLVSYYQMIVVNGGHSYLSDYLDIKNKQEVNKLTKSLEDDGGSSKGRSYIKSTGHYGNEDDKPIQMTLPNSKDNDIRAFVTNYALTFVIIASSLIIPLIAFLLG